MPKGMTAAVTQGFLLLDKETGVSSFQALHPVKRLFKGLKVGHAGTLDPAATGLLLVGIGSATRLLEFLEGMSKVYRFDMQLGVETDSYDLEGEVVARHSVPAFTKEEILAAMAPFRGRIQQTPPVYSAIKIQGKRACDRVRDGETVEIKARDVTLHRLDLIALRGDRLTLEMHCSKGTYVRTLAHDLGKALGCGAAATDIRRMRIGPFDVSRAKLATQIQGPEDLLSMAAAVAHLPGLRVLDRWIAPLLNGNPVPHTGYTELAQGEQGALAERSDSGALGDSVTSPIPDGLAPEDSAPIEDGLPLQRVLDRNGRLLAIAQVNPLRLLTPRKVLAHL